MRKVEALAQEDKSESKKSKEKTANPYEALQQELSERTGWKIKIQDGKVIIAYTDEEELNQIADRLR